MTRLKLQDTGFDVVYKMSEGNPGALNVCLQILQNGEQIDPDAALGGLGALLGLDTLGIYGSDIWLFYKDVCGQNLTNALGILRAWQLGNLSKTQLAEAIQSCKNARHQHTLDVDGLVAQVKEQLPAFGKAAETATEMVGA